MRIARLTALSAVLAFLSMLAACGGGGGGGTVPSPGGGNGGGGTATPSPRPTATATASSTATPTSSPTATPTPLPTATPTPLPTATPTPRAGQTTIGVGSGQVNGTDDQIKTSAPNDHNNAGEGDLMPGDPGATAQGGGQGATIDGIPCEISMSNNYHVHVFLGIIDNGQEIAVPDGIGMVDPSGEFTINGAPNQETYANCFYYMHTHDASGMVHLEAPSPTCGQPVNWNPPCNMSIFTFGNLLDIWGISISPANFGPFSGPVSIYATPQQQIPCGGGTACYTPSSDYSLYTGDPTQIQLYSHMAIWIVIGTPPATPQALPNIEWYTGSS